MRVYPYLLECLYNGEVVDLSKVQEFFKALSACHLIEAMLAHVFVAILCGGYAVVIITIYSDNVVAVVDFNNGAIVALEKVLASVRDFELVSNRAIGSGRIHVRNSHHV